MTPPPPQISKSTILTSIPLSGLHNWNLLLVNLLSIITSSCNRTIPDTSNVPINDTSLVTVSVFANLTGFITSSSPLITVLPVSPETVNVGSTVLNPFS